MWRRHRANREEEPGESEEIEVEVRGFRLQRLRRLFGRGSRPEISEEELDAPPIVLACTQCRFDYTVEKIDFGKGRVGAFWICACGSRYFPPGGEESFELVRP